MTLIGRRMESLLNVFRIPNKLVITQESFREDTGHSSVLEIRKMVWDVCSQTRREMGPASQSDDWEVPTKWSSHIPRRKCARPQKHYSVHGGLREHWIDAAHHYSLSKSAQQQCRVGAWTWLKRCMVRHPFLQKMISSHNSWIREKLVPWYETSQRQRESWETVGTFTCDDSKWWIFTWRSMIQKDSLWKNILQNRWGREW